MAKGDDIEERLVDFAVRILKLCNQLPRSPAGRHVAGQLVRSGTAPAPNYAEARGAESTNDFIHKLKICLKELNESRVWLLIIQKSNRSYAVTASPPAPSPKTTGEGERQLRNF